MVFFSMSKIKKHMDSNPEQLDKPVMLTTISVALQVSIVWKTQAIWTTAVLPYLRFIATCYSILEQQPQSGVYLWVSRKGCYELALSVSLLKPCDVFHIEVGNNCSGFVTFCAERASLPSLSPKDATSLPCQRAVQGAADHLSSSIFPGTSSRQRTFNALCCWHIYSLNDVLHTASSLDPCACWNSSLQDLHSCLEEVIKQHKSSLGR